VLLERIRAEKKGSDKSHYDIKNTNEQDLFEIHDSWSWCKLGEIVSIISGVSYDKKDVSVDGIRILRGGNIQNGKILFADDDIFLPLKYESNENNIVKDDVVIVASTGSITVIGKAGFVIENSQKVQIGAFLRIIRSKYSWFNKYLNLIFQSDFYIRYIRSKARGTNINNIKNDYLTGFFIPLPPIAEQKRIVAQVEKLFAQIDNITK